MANKIKTTNFEFAVGDRITVAQKIKEGEKTRVQPFTGIVISIKAKGEASSFTVRKIAADKVGVERIWSLNSPWIDKIKVIKKGNPKRAKLYYLRGQ